MSSETINQLVGTLGELELRLQRFDAEAQRLGDLRGELRGATTGLQSAGKDLQLIASALREGASTMRELDMPAVLTRVAEIESALDARSKQLESAITREITELGESLKHQVSKQLDTLPGQLGPTVAAAFDKQFETTKRAIDALVADAGTRHSEILMAIRQGIAQGQESADRDSKLAQTVSQLGKAVREAYEKQVGTLVKALSEADARNSAHGTAIEAVITAVSRKNTRLTVIGIILAGAAAIAAVVGIFVGYLR
jgi:hypothetical protein